MIVVKAPNAYNLDGTFSVFLAGSIEGDTAENWQNYLIEKLQNEDVLLLNPRRDSWDSSWKQDINNPKFNEQVNWELDGLDEVDFIVMYFDKNTKAPISLLELGLFAKSNKIVVCCPEGYWRKGNVDILCKRFGIHMVTTLNELAAQIRNRIIENENNNII